MSRQSARAHTHTVTRAWHADCSGHCTRYRQVLHVHTRLARLHDVHDLTLGPEPSSRSLGGRQCTWVRGPLPACKSHRAALLAWLGLSTMCSSPPLFFFFPAYHQATPLARESVSRKPANASILPPFAEGSVRWVITTDAIQAASSIHPVPWKEGNMRTSFVSVGIEA